jgi:hypothetical protein
LTFENQPKKPQTEQDQLKARQRELKLVRSGTSIADHLAHGRLDKALAAAVSSGIKLAADPREVFHNPHSSPLAVVAALKTLGIQALGWKPETLMAAIDRRYYDWTDDQVAAALEHFHETGEIKTNVPSLLRQKIYAIRIISTTDIPHNEWSVFEKVGCAFNDRAVHFGLVEHLSAAECARTVALIETLRPDKYSEEVRTYIAACCHEDGLLTVKPSKYLGIANAHLQEFNAQSTGARLSTAFEDKINQKILQLKARAIEAAPLEDTETIQAIKLIAADAAGDEAISGG